jgi:hypothetical protein
LTDERTASALVAFTGASRHSLSESDSS